MKRKNKTKKKKIRKQHQHENGHSELIKSVSNKSAAKIKEKNYSLKIGEKDNGGDTIENIFARNEGKYLIYSNTKGSIKLVAEDEALTSKNPEINEALMKIADYTRANAVINKKFQNSIAYALKVLYDGYGDTCLKSLNSTYEQIQKHLKRKAEIAYLTGGLVMVLFNLVTYFLIYKFGNLNDFGYIIFSAVALSSLGGFLSIATSVKNIVVDLQNTERIIALLGGLRIVIAMISGVAVYYLIESNFFLAFLGDLNNINAMYVAFFLSGFSEKLIPNLLDFDKSDNKFIKAFKPQAESKK